MDTISNRSLFPSKYSSLALIGISLIGILNGLYVKTPNTKTLIVIVAPYLLALFLGIMLLLGKSRVLVPTLVVSAFGIILNVLEMFAKPNQKDALEVILYMLIVGLLSKDFAGKQRRAK